MLMLKYDLYVRTHKVVYSYNAYLILYINTYILQLATYICVAIWSHSVTM